MSSTSTSPASPIPSEEEKKRTPLTSAQWLEIRTLAELGTEKVRELARRFGISPQAVSQHLKEHGIVIGSKAAVVAEKAVERAVAVAVPFHEKRLERIEETRDFYYTSHSNIDRIIMGKIAIQVRDSRPLSEITGDLKALNFAKRSLLIGRSERFAVLDADNHVAADELPDLIVRDLTDEEITTMQSGEDPLDALEEMIEEVGKEIIGAGS